MDMQKFHDKKFKQFEANNTIEKGQNRYGSLVFMLLLTVFGAFIFLNTSFVEDLKTDTTNYAIKKQEQKMTKAEQDSKISDLVKKASKNANVDSDKAFEILKKGKNQDENSIKSMFSALLGEKEAQNLGNSFKTIQNDENLKNVGFDLDFDNILNEIVNIIKK